MDEQVHTASDPNWKRTAQIRRRQERLTAIRLWLHGKLWGFLWFIKLAKPLQEFMCFTGTYPKYMQGGRCHYCGEIHGFWHIRKPIDYTEIRRKLKGNRQNERYE